jgi:hypothetical protein
LVKNERDFEAFHSIIEKPHLNSIASSGYANVKETPEQHVNTIRKMILCLVSVGSLDSLQKIIMDANAPTFTKNAFFVNAGK